MRTTPLATDTRCLHKDTPRSNSCRGDLVRPNDGADRMSEHLDRIVLLCLKCGQRWSCSTSEVEYKRKV
jgi:hypothetical protein